MVLSAYVWDRNDRNFFKPNFLFFIWLQKHHNSNRVYLHNWLFQAKGLFLITFYLLENIKGFKWCEYANESFYVLVINLIKMRYLGALTRSGFETFLCLNIFIHTCRNIWKQSTVPTLPRDLHYVLWFLWASVSSSIKWGWGQGVWWAL